MKMLVRDGIAEAWAGEQREGSNEGEQSVEMHSIAKHGTTEHNTGFSRGIPCLQQK